MRIDHAMGAADMQYDEASNVLEGYIDIRTSCELSRSDFDMLCRILKILDSDVIID